MDIDICLCQFDLKVERSERCERQFFSEFESWVEVKSRHLVNGKRNVDMYNSSVGWEMILADDDIE